MLIKDTIPFVDNTAALPQSGYPHPEQQGISISLPNRQQMHIHNIYISPRSSCSAGQNTSSSLLNAAFGQNPRHAQHCRRSPPKLLPASQQKCWLTKHYSSVRSDSCIRQWWPSSSAGLRLQRHHTGNNPSQPLQLWADQTNENLFTATRI